MRVHFKAMESYGPGNAAAQAATANRVDLIQMLFDGLLESLTAAQGHLQRGAIQEKGKCLARASRIVVGLQSSLDFEKGGELAQNLNELYSYVTRRLLHANARNDAQALSEVLGLMGDIRQAWAEVPSLVPPQILGTLH
ncbi:MAG: flagellar export chaperone FliS [Burkholderiales bacterium]|nr:flagellar export chaperone FliS [Burkholderiales bacterium]